MKYPQLPQQKYEIKALPSELNLIFRLDRELAYIYVKSSIPQKSLNFSEYLKHIVADLYLSQETISLWEKLAKEVFKTCQELQVELEILTSHGERHYQVDLVPEFTTHGSVEFVLGIVRDVTKNKQTEVALRQSKAKFRAMFDLPVGMALVDKTGILLQTNAVLQTIINYSAEALQNQLINNFIHPDDQEQSLKLFQELLTGERRNFDLEQRYIRKDGTCVWVSTAVSAIYSSTDLLESAIVLIQDISTQKQAELTWNIICSELDQEVREEIGELTKTKLELKQEIVQYQQIQINLQNQKEFVQNILDIAPSFIYLKDTIGKYLLVNQSYAEVWGKNVEEVVGKTFGELHSVPAEIDAVIANDQKLLSTLQPQFIAEQAYHTVTGEVRWYQTRKKLIVNSQDEYQILGVSTEITERKQVEDALRESEQRYRLLIERMNDGVIIIDSNGLISYTNEKLLEMTGYSSLEIIGHYYWELGDKYTEKIIGIQTFQQRKNENTSYELPINKKDGQRILTIVSMAPIWGSDDSFEGSFCVIKDITTLKHIQLELQQAKERLRAVLDAVPGLISWISSEGKYIGVNQQLADNFNLLPDAFVEQEIGFINCRCEFTQFIEKFIASSYQTKRRVIDVQISGITRNYLVAAQKYNQGNAVVSVGIDITEGKVAEEQLRQREEQLRLALDAANMGFWDWNLQTGFVTLSSNHEKLFGISLEAYDGTKESFLTIVHPEDRHRVSYGDLKAIEVGKPCDVEYRVILPDGEIRWIESKGQAYYDAAGKPLRLTGVNLDITERKNSQIAINDQHKFLQTVIDTNPNLIFVKDLDGRYVMVNQAFANFYNITIEQLIGKTDASFNFNSGEVQKFVLQDQEVLATAEQKFIPEENCCSKAGEIHWFQTIKRPLCDVNGQAYQVLGVSTDITERKQVEEQLRKSESQLRLALDAARMGHWERDIKACKINVSNNFEKLYDFAPNTYDGTYETYLEKIHPEDRERVKQATEHSINTGAERDLEFRVVWQDGTIHWLCSKGQVIYDEAGEAAFLSGISLDISDHKLADAQLKQSQEQLHRALEAAHMGFWEWNLQTNTTNYSSNLKQLYGLDPHTYEVTYEGFINLVHPEDRDYLQQVIQECLITGNDYNVEFRIVLSDGSIRWMEGKGQIFYDEMGKPLRMTGIDLDISKRKQAETEIKEALREKEVLLQEIHHRVKNNLQVISSLLDLQSQRFTDQVALEVFQESQNRIKLMSLVHETLYKYKDFVKLNFSEFVKTLTDYLFRAYQKEAGEITLELKLEQVKLKLDKAIPCGLIISELISNSLKYAFPNQIPGKISLSLNHDEHNYINLIIQDNGVGFPVDWESGKGKSLGMQLVNILTNQLEGTIEINHRMGSEFKIRFLELDD
jgi:PAS domain S-box-containing protein